MTGRRIVRWSVLLGLLGFWTLTGSGSESQSGVVGEPRVYLSDPVARHVMTRAIAGALRRLSRPDCRLVLEDFADERGQRLHEVLAALDLTAATYLVERLWFVDGSTAPQCLKADRPRAFTAPGNKVIRICAARFARHSAPGGVSLDLLVIHEMLHTLGLGENPPSSVEITRQVSRRCGRS